MPEISIRGRRMPESPIRKLAPYAEIAKKKGLSIAITPTDNDSFVENTNQHHEHDQAH